MILTHHWEMPHCNVPKLRAKFCLLSCVWCIALSSMIWRSASLTEARTDAKLCMGLPACAAGFPLPLLSWWHLSNRTLWALPPAMSFFSNPKQNTPWAVFKCVGMSIGTQHSVGLSGSTHGVVLTACVLLLAPSLLAACQCPHLQNGHDPGSMYYRVFMQRKGVVT